MLQCAAAENLLGDIVRGADAKQPAAEAEATYRLATREKLLGLHHLDVAFSLLGVLLFMKSYLCHAAMKEGL